MRANQKDKTLARKLLELSLEGESLSPERVDAVLTTLREKPPARHLQVLRTYAHLITRELTKSTAVIETAADLQSQSISEIESTLSARYGRPITAQVQTNPDVIAGIRIHIADDVWDDTVATHLNTLQS